MNEHVLSVIIYLHDLDVVLFVIRGVSADEEFLDGAV